MNRKLKKNKVDAVNRYRYGPNTNKSYSVRHSPNTKANANCLSIETRGRLYRNQSCSPHLLQRNNSSNSSIKSEEITIILDDDYNIFEEDKSLFSEDYFKAAQKKREVSFKEMSCSFKKLFHNKVNLIHLFFDEKPFSSFIYKSVFKNRKFSGNFIFVIYFFIDIKYNTTFKDYQKIIIAKKELQTLEEMKKNNPEMNGKLLEKLKTYIDDNIINKYQMVIDWKEANGVFSYIRKDYHQRTLVITLFQDMMNIKYLQLVDQGSEDEEYDTLKVVDNSNGDKTIELDVILGEFVKDIQNKGLRC